MDCEMLVPMKRACIANDEPLRSDPHHLWGDCFSDVLNFAGSMLFQVPWRMPAVEDGVMKCQVPPNEGVLDMRHPYPSDWGAANAAPDCEGAEPVVSQAATLRLVASRTGASTGLQLIFWYSVHRQR